MSANTVPPCLKIFQLIDRLAVGRGCARLPRMAAICISRARDLLSEMSSSRLSSHPPSDQPSDRARTRGINRRKWDRPDYGRGRGPSRRNGNVVRHVRFTPNNGHSRVRSDCPLSATSGLMHRSK